MTQAQKAETMADAENFMDRNLALEVVRVTEAAALAVAQKSRHGGMFAALPTEHDCFLDWMELKKEF